MAEKGKKMYSKGYVVAQANEIAKKAGLDGAILFGPPKDLNEEEYAKFINRFKKEVNEQLLHKGTKTQDIELDRKELCAGIQFLKTMYEPYLKYLDPDSDLAAELLMIVRTCDLVIKRVWENISEKSIVSVTIEIPNFNDKGE